MGAVEKEGGLTDVEVAAGREATVTVAETAEGVR